MEKKQKTENNFFPKKQRKRGKKVRKGGRKKGRKKGGRRQKNFRKLLLIIRCLYATLSRDVCVHLLYRVKLPRAVCVKRGGKNTPPRRAERSHVRWRSCSWSRGFTQ